MAISVDQTLLAFHKACVTTTKRVGHTHTHTHTLVRFRVLRLLASTEPPRSQGSSSRLVVDLQEAALHKEPACLAAGIRLREEKKQPKPTRAGETGGLIYMCPFARNRWD